MKPYCPHCLPNKRRSHFDLHADYYFEKIRKVFFAPYKFLEPKNWKNPDIVWSSILNIFSLLGAVQFVRDPDEKEIYNRSLIIFREARKRGIEIEAIKIFGAFKNEFRYRIGGKYSYFEINPLANVWNSKIIDEKIETKKLLAANSIPAPHGWMFTSLGKALAFGLNLKFPLAVKPNAGSLGHHGTYPVSSKEELAAALRLAFQYRPDVIVEKYLAGTNYRATVIGREHVFVAEKQIASVIGDGRSTIAELINRRNSDPRRGDLGQKNYTLFRLPVPFPPLEGEGQGGVNQDLTNKLLNHLSIQNLTLESILPARQKITLFSDFLPGAVDVFDVTAKTHSENIEIFLRAAKALNTDIVGFDLIADDMALPYSAQTFGILEANSAPYIDMHAFPTEGEPSPIAELVWDIVAERLNRGLSRAKSRG